MGWAARANKRRGLIRPVNPLSSEQFAEHITANAVHCRAVVEPGSAAGQSLVICGAGPSLADTIGRFWGDQVWACNGALPWLLEHGHRVTHGFTVNQTRDIVVMWERCVGVGFLLASTVCPDLPMVLVDRPMTWFHNVVDCHTQDDLYRSLYPETVVAGSGLSAVTRALDVADYMGFSSITVLGADCCLRDGVMHVGGGRPEDDGCAPAILSGVIDGRTWTMQPDMAVSANWLVRMARNSGGRISLVGDTFPNAIIGKPAEFLERLPHMVTPSGARVPMPAA